jgi:hypothetical protein
MQSTEAGASSVGQLGAQLPRKKRRRLQRRRVVGSGKPTTDASVLRSASTFEEYRCRGTLELVAGDGAVDFVRPSEAHGAHRGVLWQAKVGGYAAGAVGLDRVSMIAGRAGPATLIMAICSRPLLPTCPSCPMPRGRADASSRCPCGRDVRSSHTECSAIFLPNAAGEQALYIFSRATSAEPTCAWWCGWARPGGGLAPSRSRGLRRAACSRQARGRCRG